NDPICFSPFLYRARNLVERFFNKVKQCRRVATRYDKLATNFLALIQLAPIRLWLRVNESTPLLGNERGPSRVFQHSGRPCEDEKKPQSGLGRNQTEGCSEGAE